MGTRAQWRSPKNHLGYCVKVRSYPSYFAPPPHLLHCQHSANLVTYSHPYHPTLSSTRLPTNSYVSIFMLGLLRHPLFPTQSSHSNLRHIYSHKKNSMVTRPTRWHPRHRPHYYRQRNSKMKLNVDGLFFQTTISDSITNKLQTPLLPPQFRGIRHLIKNNETFASNELMRVIHAAVKAELGKVGITGLMKFSNEEWIVAPPLRNQRVRSSGIIHRDVPYKSSGYLTVIILLGKTSERGYGSINLWQNSHLLESGRTSHYPKNFKRDHLDKCGPATIDLKKNLIIFDSRLIHQSLPHSQYYVYAFPVDVYVSIIGDFYF